MRLKPKQKLYIFVIFITLIYINNIIKNMKNSDLIYIEPDISNQSKLFCYPFYNNYYQYHVNFNGTVYPKLLPLAVNRSINFKCLQKSNKIKRILLWNNFVGDSTFGFPMGIGTAFEEMKCPITNCELTNDKSKLDESDYVVVHMGEEISPIPKTRPKHQRWIFYFFESQGNYNLFSQYDGMFNLRATFQTDTEFSQFYEYDNKMYWIKNDSFDANYNFAKDKSNLAAGVISNCGGSSRRLEYIQEMQKYAPIDVYGKCGSPCLVNDTLGCKIKIAQEYKFYLAFENSICQDYITEKFFFIIRQNVVPVVLGGGNYDNFIPKSAYIDVRDFESPKKLAEYLLYLDSNITAYNSYFKWKEHVSFLDNAYRIHPFCNMCIRLQLERYTGFFKSSIRNINKIWNKDQCKFPQFKENKFIV